MGGRGRRVTPSSNPIQSTTILHAVSTSTLHKAIYYSTADPYVQQKSALTPPPSTPQHPQQKLCAQQHGRVQSLFGLVLLPYLVNKRKILTLFRIDLGKCIHLYDETRGTIKHKRFRKKSSSGVRRQIIIKEEGSREEDRQGVDAIYYLFFNYFNYLSIFLHLTKPFCRKRLCFIVPCVSSYR